MTNILIDWMSFTIPVNSLHENATQQQINAAWSEAYVSEFKTIAPQLLELIGTAEHSPGRRPYSDAWKHPLGMTFANPKLTTMLFEITGKGMELLRNESLDKLFIRQFAERMSRIDLAIDFENTIAPSEFEALIPDSRFKSRSLIQSQTGETLYIGSRKSSRYLRIYRYHLPHPRANLLRFEFVYRKRHAKAIASGLVESRYDLSSLAKQSLLDFGFWSIAAMIEGTEFNTSYQRPDKQNAGTIRWLITSVAPAFRRLVKEDSITNPEEFLQEYFLS